MRLLKDVPTRALYALHKGIERQAELGFGSLIEVDDTRCSIGSLAGGREDIIRVAKELELFADADNWANYIRTAAGNSVIVMNDTFGGNGKQRREFMLRHIVSELHCRELKLPEENTAAKMAQPVTSFKGTVKE